MRYLTFLSAILLASVLVAESCIPKISETLHGTCITVKDGDTIAIASNKQLITVRLEGVDAPEKGQDHGSKATEALTEWIKGKEVSVGVTGKDRYGRTLGILTCNGENINEKLLSEGWAWQYLEYNCDEKFADLQKAAKAKKIGLWAHSNAIPPWEFRKLERERIELQKQRAAELAAQPKPIISPPVMEQKESKTSVSYWLNTSGNVRHNSTCRYYHNTKKGRSCGASEGKACGICGG